MLKDEVVDFLYASRPGENMKIYMYIYIFIKA